RGDESLLETRFRPLYSAAVAWVFVAGFASRAIYAWTVGASAERLPGAVSKRQALGANCVPCVEDSATQILPTCRLLEDHRRQLKTGGDGRHVHAQTRRGPATRVQPRPTGGIGSSCI